MLGLGKRSRHVVGVMAEEMGEGPQENTSELAEGITCDL